MMFNTETLHFLWIFVFSLGQILTTTALQQQPRHDDDHRCARKSHCKVHVKPHDDFSLHAHHSQSLGNNIFSITITTDLHSRFELNGAQVTDFTQEVTVKRDKTLLLSYQFYQAPMQPSHLLVKWLSSSHGQVTGEFDIVNSTITGKLHGREITPFFIVNDPQTATFADGDPISQFNYSAWLDPTSLKNLQSQLSLLLNSCQVSEIVGSDSHRALLKRNIQQDYGHFSPSHFSTPECIICHGEKVGVGVVDVVGGCATGFAFGCVLGIGKGVYDVFTGIQDCRTSTACCQVSCQPGGFLSAPHCCLTGEKCLNPNGLCCSSGTSPCENIACCSADEICKTSGPQKGVCCPALQNCGTKCCEDGTRCQNPLTEQCCSPSGFCGADVCCDGLVPPGSTGLLLSYCADSSKGLCCSTGLGPFATIDCGGVCCPLTSCCKNVCCPSGTACMNDVCTTPAPGTPEACQILGFAGPVCTTTDDCPFKYECSVGCCIEVVK
jgi:hypothetical protein